MQNVKNLKILLLEVDFAPSQALTHSSLGFLDRFRSPVYFLHHHPSKAGLALAQGAHLLKALLEFSLAELLRLFNSNWGRHLPIGHSAGERRSFVVLDDGGLSAQEAAEVLLLCLGNLLLNLFRVEGL